MVDSGLGPLSAHPAAALRCGGAAQHRQAAGRRLRLGTGRDRCRTARLARNHDDGAALS